MGPPPTSTEPLPSPHGRKPRLPASLLLWPTLTPKKFSRPPLSPRRLPTMLSMPNTPSEKLPPLLIRLLRSKRKPLELPMTMPPRPKKLPTRPSSSTPLNTVTLPLLNGVHLHLHKELASLGDGEKMLSDTPLCLIRKPNLFINSS